MKSITLLLFSILVLVINAQPSTYPDINYTSLFRMDVQGDIIVAHGTCDIMYISTDRGESWTIVSELEHNVNDIAILPDRNSMVVTSTQGVLELDYQGQVLANHLELALNEVEADDTHVYVNRQGVVYQASITDLVFAEVAADTLAINFAVMELTDNYLYAAAWDGRLLKIDRATHQIQIMHDLGGRVGSLTMADDENGYLIPPSRSRVLRTSDGWVTYSAADGFPEAINPVCIGDTVLTINTNRIYRSTDAGETSERITTANNRAFALTSKAQFDQQGRLYIVGRANMIGYSDDLGETFSFFDPYNRSHLYDADLNTSGMGWAVGQWNTLLHTTDDGLTWTDVDLDLGSQDVLANVATLPDGTAIVSSSRELLHLSASEIISRQDMAMIGDMYYHEPSGTLLLSQRQNDGSDILRSLDNGDSWETVLSSPHEYPIISVSYDGSINIAGGSEMYHTTVDLGTTWTDVTTNLERVVSISRLNDRELLALEFGKVYKSSDNGQSWLQVASAYAIREVTVIDEQTYFYTGGSNSWTNIRLTNDGGATWTSIHRNCNATNDFEVLSDGRVLMIQDYGHINTFDLPLPSSTDTPSDLTQLDVYPNPINSGDNIFLGESVASVTIYDLNGQLINTDLNTDRLRIHAPPGLYLIQSISTSGHRKVSKIIVH